jgi:hypothetical protein
LGRQWSNEAPRSSDAWRKSNKVAWVVKQ